MESLRIKNWETYQHYQHRKPPWIKLYRDILDDKDWHELSGDTAKGLVMLWLIASENEGYLPDSKTLAFRLRISENRAIALLSDCSHWLEGHASNVLADCKQDAIPEKSRDRVRVETEKSKSEPSVRPPTYAKPFLEGFSLDAEMMIFATERGLDPQEEFAAFADYHKSKGSLFKNWPAAFRTWVRNSKKFNGGKSNGATKTDTRGQRTASAISRVLGDSGPVAGDVRPALPTSH